MRNMRKITMILCLLPALAWAEPDPLKPDQISGFVELGMSYADLTSSLASWKDMYLKSHIQLTPTDSIQGEISSQNHFDDSGTFFGAGWTHIYNDDWYGSLSLGSSDSGFFLPKLRMDAALYRKWLPQRNLVTGATLGYNRAKDSHYDRSMVLNAVYYFDGPWIAEGGMRINESNPGGVTTSRGFAAITWGRNKDRYLVLRHESGREGYQLITAGTAVVDFSSKETTLIWREWLSPKSGFNLSAAHYSNPYYQRNGLTVGFFREF